MSTDALALAALGVSIVTLLLQLYHMRRDPNVPEI